MNTSIRTAALLLALLSVSMAVPGCTTTGTPPPATPVLTKVVDVVDCAADKVQSQLPSIITDVTTDLLSKDYVGLLTKLAQRVGDDAVVCAVALAATAAENRKAAHPGSAQPNADVVTANAMAYLTAREVRFASGLASGPFCSPACVPPLVCRVPTGPAPKPGWGICVP
jgi:hypothetical protein